MSKILAVALTAFSLLMPAAAAFADDTFNHHHGPHQPYKPLCDEVCQANRANGATTGFINPPPEKSGPIQAPGPIGAPKRLPL